MISEKIAAPEEAGTPENVETDAVPDGMREDGEMPVEGEELTAAEEIPEEEEAEKPE